MSRQVLAPEIFKRFTAVGDWISSSLLPRDPALEATLKANEAANLDAIDVAPNEGKFLYLLTKMNNAKRVLEVGTLGGYSAIWFAKAVGPAGKVTTLELEKEHAAVAEKNIANAGYDEVVEIKVGPALDSLEKMWKEGYGKREEEGGKGKFDIVFIDADKQNNSGYLGWALKMWRKGTVVVLDNVVRQGRVLNIPGDDASQGVRAVFDMMRQEKRLECTALQTVGPKGWDGFAVALIVED